MKTPIISNENKPTINIKITDLESGKELLNRNTNTIIGGCADNEGNCSSIVSIDGARISVIFALQANEKAQEQLKHQCPIEVLLYEALKPLTAPKSDKEKSFKTQSIDALSNESLMEKLKRVLEDD